MPKPHEQLVIQHLENVSRRLLDKHQDVVREYVKGRHGVYALYRNDKLYYVGLASNLRNRLRTHLKGQARSRLEQIQSLPNRRRRVPEGARSSGVANHRAIGQQGPHEVAAFSGPEQILQAQYDRQLPA